MSCSKEKKFYELYRMNKCEVCKNEQIVFKVGIIQYNTDLKQFFRNIRIGSFIIEHRECYYSEQSIAFLAGVFKSQNFLKS